EVLRYLHRFRRRFLLGVLFLLATNALSLAIPRLLKQAVEAMEQGSDLDRVGRTAAVILAVASLQALVRSLSRVQLLGMSREVAFDLRSRLFDHLTRLPPAWFDRVRTGDVMSRAVNDMSSVRSLFGPGLMNLCNTVIVYGAGLVLMARIDWRMTLLALVPYPLLLAAVQRAGRLVQRRTNEAQEQLGEISNHLQENLSGALLVRAFAQEEQEIRRFEERNRDYLRRNLRLALARGGIVSIMGAVGGLGTAVVLWLGGLRVLSGRISLGDFVAFNGYLGLLAWPTVAMGWVINVFQRGGAALRRIGEILDAVPAPTGTTDGDDGLQARPEVELRGVSFAYAGGLRPALSDVTLRVPAGAFVGVVGGVGSGKSTLAHLIARLYPPGSGEIRIGGERLESMPAGRLRRTVGLAPQEPFLFSNTLLENVGLGLDPLDPERILESGRIARLDPDVAEMPAGWETLVGERGHTLSGGQRQRAALARTVAPRPAVLILDDSLSSLDAETERAVLERLRREMRDGILILISHRLTSVLGADRVFFLRDGRLVEAGPPGELLGAGGPFSAMFRRQQTGWEADR
ncbi:MAG: ABC transporter ATP-binding protein, partial [Acidobacteria bacterium]|nr:ABC transporter ATP-binding protein [Acidobacteriota bacterium]